jgi:hypothetical protein
MNARVWRAVSGGFFCRLVKGMNGLKRKYQTRVGVLKGLECVKWDTSI